MLPCNGTECACIVIHRYSKKSLQNMQIVGKQAHTPPSNRESETFVIARVITPDLAARLLALLWERRAEARSATIANPCGLTFKLRCT